MTVFGIGSKSLRWKLSQPIYNNQNQEEEKTVKKEVSSTQAAAIIGVVVVIIAIVGFMMFRRNTLSPEEVQQGNQATQAQIDQDYKKQNEMMRKGQMPGMQ
jgi:flagellar basal body-associated protein FliL